MNLSFTLYGQPITKKNSPRIVKAGRRAMLLPSAQYKQYEKDCLKQITGQARKRIDFPVNVQSVFYMQTRRRVDKSNLEAALHDILVAAGVLEDDNRDIIAGTDGSRVLYDKQNPRVEITITEMRDYAQWKQTERVRVKR